MNNVTPEEQKFVDGYNLVNKINMYGREIVEVQKIEFVRSNVDDYNAPIKVIKDFKELEEGCETWIEGEKYPMRLCFQGDRIKTAHHFKKIFPAIFRTFKKNKIISLWYFKNNWQEWIRFVHYSMTDAFYSERKYYSQSVREIHRVLTGYNEWVDKIRDIGCAILESDPAYRYRVQDIVPLIDKDAFNRNPVKEINRLIDIFKSREKTDMISNKFGKFIPVGLFYLRFNRKLLKAIKKIVNELNLEEIKSSKEDIYWQNARFETYNSRGLSNEIRKKLYAEDNKENLKVVA